MVFRKPLIFDFYQMTPVMRIFAYYLKLSSQYNAVHSIPDSEPVVLSCKIWTQRQ